MLRELVGQRLTADWTGRILVGSGGDQGLESELRGMITGRTVFLPVILTIEAYAPIRLFPE